MARRMPIKKYKLAMSVFWKNLSMDVDKLVLSGLRSLARSTTSQTTPSPSNKPKYGGKCAKVINRGRKKDKRHRLITNHSIFPNGFAYSALSLVSETIDLPINKVLAKKTVSDGRNAWVKIV